MTFVVALTGGIGSGKTTVSNFFEALEVPVIDTDLIARDLVSVNSHCYEVIVKQFGRNILLEDLSLNRKKLRDIIFNDKAAKQWLEQLLHPQIIKVVEQTIARCTAPYCIVVVPLLVELYDKFGHLADRVLVVDTTEVLQSRRLIDRDQISPDLSQKILAAQYSRKQRLEKADDVLINNTDLLTLKKNVFMLHHKYLQLSADRHSNQNT